MRTRYDIITTIIVILLFAFILFMKKDNIKECKIAYQQGIKDGRRLQIRENIKNGFMNKKVIAQLKNEYSCIKNKKPVNNKPLFYIEFTKLEKEYLRGWENGNDNGMCCQRQINIEHGVMNKSGKWLNEFELAR